jgi:formate hydrogenlyase subunit 3/multisubunit Na+/H+ antiporter MnhD subunit
MSLRLDGLGLLFAVLVLAISAPVTLYAIGHRHHDRLAFRGSGVLFGLFVLSMLGVAVAADAFTFLIAWETMSLASFALVLADHRRSEVRRAGWVYTSVTWTPDRATAATLRSTRRPTPSMTSSASGSISSPPRVTPTCCWSPAR